MLRENVPIELAIANRHPHLYSILMPTETDGHSVSSADFDNIDSVLTACALRFDGYAFESFLHRTNAPLKELFDIVEPIIKSRTLYPDQNYNFAAFFALQRGLSKWGGEHLTIYSDDHIAYDFLFLHLYRLTPPAEFSSPNYLKRWETDFRPIAEAAAALIRNRFRRVGSGPKAI